MRESVLTQSHEMCTVRGDSNKGGRWRPGEWPQRGQIKGLSPEGAFPEIPPEALQQPFFTTRQDPFFLFQWKAMLFPFSCMFVSLSPPSLFYPLGLCFRLLLRLPLRRPR